MIHSGIFLWNDFLEAIYTKPKQTVSVSLGKEHYIHSGCFMLRYLSNFQEEVSILTFRSCCSDLLMDCCDDNAKKIIAKNLFNMHVRFSCDYCAKSFIWTGHRGYVFHISFSMYFEYSPNQMHCISLSTDNSDDDNSQGMALNVNAAGTPKIHNRSRDDAESEIEYQKDVFKVAKREVTYTENYGEIFAPCKSYCMPKVFFNMTGIPVDKCFGFNYELRKTTNSGLPKLFLRELFELRCIQTSPNPNWSHFLCDGKTSTTMSFAITKRADDLLVKLWSAMNGRLLFTFRCASAEITEIVINLENTLLAAGSLDHILRVWDFQMASPITVLCCHTGVITFVNFCPSTLDHHKYLVTTSTNGSVAFWQYVTLGDGKTQFAQKLTQHLEKLRPGHAQMIYASFSPELFLAAGSVCNIACGEPKRILETEAHGDTVDSRQCTALVWHFESQQWKFMKLEMSEWLSSFQLPTDDFSIKVWNADTRKLHRVMRGHTDELYVLESHLKDPHILISAGNSKTVMVIDFGATRFRCNTDEVINNYEERNNKVLVLSRTMKFLIGKFSLDGCWIASADKRGSVIISNIQTKKKIDEYKEKPFKVLLAAVRYDSTVDLYDFEKKQSIWRMHGEGECCFFDSAEYISVFGWKSDREYNHIESAWSWLGVMKVVTKKIVRKLKNFFLHFLSPQT